MINRKYHICIWLFGGLLTALGVQAQTAVAQPDTLTSATVVDKEQSDVVTAGNEQSITLSEAIALARIRSVDAAVALNQLKTAYWEYRTFRADLLPEVNFTGTLPDYNKSYGSYQNSDGSYTFVRSNSLGLSGELSIDQNIWFTGGNLFIQTATQRMDELTTKTKAYNTQPITIGYRQSLFGYNSLKWDRRIEPVRFREAKKSYAETLELIASKTCDLFFSLATAQANLQIAKSNYASADTLYRYAKGRYEIGSISENEMLQLEVNRLNEETNVMKAQIEVEEAALTFRSFLGLREDENLEVLPSVEDIVAFEVPLDRALELAYAYSPEMETYERMRLESKSNLAAARAERGLKADLYLQFGLSQTGEELRASYRNPLNQQYVSLSLAIPILDWGRGKGKVRVAKSQMELVDTQVGQAMTDFELNVRKMVRQFNLQAKQVQVAQKTDETARKRYEVAMKLYLMGKSSILDLNAATTEKDAAQRNYLSAMKTYVIICRR